MARQLINVHLTPNDPVDGFTYVPGMRFTLDTATQQARIDRLKAVDGISVDETIDSSSVVLTGGTIDGVDIGGTTPGVGDFSLVRVDNLALDGNNISSLDTNGNIRLVPNGTGMVGVGVTTPTAMLHIESDEDSRPGLLVETSGANAWGLEVGSHALPSETDIVTNGNAAIGAQSSLNLTMEAGGEWVFWGGATSHKTGTAGATKVVSISDTGAAVFGQATGGEKGDGTINAKGVYDDDTLVTDLVLDFAVDGAWDREAYAQHPVDMILEDWMLDPANYWVSCERNRHLPLMVSWRDEGNKPSHGESITRLTGEAELHAVHIGNHEDRLQRLEALVANLEAQAS